MEESPLWGMYSSALKSFCLDINKNRTDTSKIVSAISGDDLEWCGTHSFLFFASKYITMNKTNEKLAEKCKQLENQLTMELSTSSQLRKQIKQAHATAEDSEWHYQEQITHLTKQANAEKELNNELKQRLLAAESKLVDVEMFMQSDRGGLVQQLEQELAECRLRMAELESHKDELELELRRRSTQTTYFTLDSNNAYSWDSNYYSKRKNFP